MINHIWVILILLGVLISIFTGSINELGDVILQSADDAFNMFIKVALMIVLWNGIFNIAIKSGLIKHLSNALKRPLHFLFPELATDSLALEYIASNMIANLLGLGAAAMPLGLKAFQELQKDNPHPETATRSMVTFILINASSLTLFPTTIFGLRALYGAKTDNLLIFLMIALSTISTIVAIILDRIFYFFEKRKKK